MEEYYQYDGGKYTAARDNKSYYDNLALSSTATEPHIKLGVTDYEKSTQFILPSGLSSQLLIQQQLEKSDRLEQDTLQHVYNMHIHSYHDRTAGIYPEPPLHIPYSNSQSNRSQLDTMIPPALPYNIPDSMSAVDLIEQDKKRLLVDDNYGANNHLNDNIMLPCMSLGLCVLFTCIIILVLFFLTKLILYIFLLTFSIIVFICSRLCRPAG